ncbi:hypothetical protein HAX54_030006, partial [Datura stramonium]|nr:hypothetical protein [Datura stramonium]
QTRYGDPEAATADSMITSPIHYSEAPTVTTVSLRWKFYRCNGPLKLVAPQNQPLSLSHSTTLLLSTT